MIYVSGSWLGTALPWFTLRLRLAAASDSVLVPVQSKLEEIEADLTVINENSERLKKTQAELSELQLVLEKAGAFFDEARQSAHGTTSGDSGAASVDAPLLDDVPVSRRTLLNSCML